MLNLTINIEGRTESDILLALEEAKRVIDKGTRFGQDKNESGNYNFSIEGEEEIPKYKLNYDRKLYIIDKIYNINKRYITI